MYRVCCTIHYECNYIDDWEYGEYADFQDAVNVFFDLAHILFVRMKKEFI